MGCEYREIKIPTQSCFLGLQKKLAALPDGITTAKCYLFMTQKQDYCRLQIAIAYTQTQAQYPLKNDQHLENVKDIEMPSEEERNLGKMAMQRHLISTGMSNINVFLSISNQLQVCI